MSFLMYFLLFISLIANSADLSIVGGAPNSQLPFVKDLVDDTAELEENVNDSYSTKWLSIFSKMNLSSIDVLVADSAKLNYNSVNSVLDANKNKVVLVSVTPEKGFLCLQMKKQTQVVFVLPAGDTRKNLNKTGVKWCQAPNIISVGGLSKNGRLAGFSSFGNSYIRVAAPAQNIKVTNESGRTQVLSSTNAAAAIVAAELALYAKKFPRLSGIYLADKFIRSKTYRKRNLTRLVKGGRALLRTGKKLN